MKPTPPDTAKIRVGDAVTYVRNSTGSEITGTVLEVLDPDAPGDRRVFINPQLQGAKLAFRLRLSPEDMEEVQHPVTLADHRVIRVVHQHGSTPNVQTYGTVQQATVEDLREILLCGTLGDTFGRPVVQETYAMAGETAEQRTLRRENNREFLESLEIPPNTDLPDDTINRLGTQVCTQGDRVKVSTLKALRAYEQGKYKKFRRHYHAARARMAPFDPNTQPKSASMEYSGGKLRIPNIDAWLPLFNRLETCWREDVNTRQGKQDD